MNAIAFTLLIIYDKPIPAFVIDNWHKVCPTAIPVIHTLSTARYTIENTFGYDNDSEVMVYFDNARPANKVHLFRYLYLYFYGGAYVDVDLEPVQHCKDFWNSDIALGRSHNRSFGSNTFLWARRPGLFFFKSIIEEMIANPSVPPLVLQKNLVENSPSLDIWFPSLDIWFYDEICPPRNGRCMLITPSHELFAYSRYTRYHDGKFELIERNVTFETSTLIYVIVVVVTLLSLFCLCELCRREHYTTTDRPPHQGNKAPLLA